MVFLFFTKVRRRRDTPFYRVPPIGACPPPRGGSGHSASRELRVARVDANRAGERVTVFTDVTAIPTAPLSRGRGWLPRSRGGEAQPSSGGQLQRPVYRPRRSRMAGPARARCSQGPADPLGRSRRQSPAGPPRAAAGPGEPLPAANSRRRECACVCACVCQTPGQRCREPSEPGPGPTPPARSSRSPALRPGWGRSRCCRQAEAVRPLGKGLARAAGSRSR